MKTVSSKVLSMVVAGVVGAAMPTAAPAQWTVTNLHPSGPFSSQAWGLDTGPQVGRTYASGTNRAALWSGSAESWVDLNPAGATLSQALDVQAGSQVGSARFGSNEDHAGLWNGSAASWVNLSPAGSTFSQARGPCTGCDPDINSSGAVDIDDLLAVISAWGPCS